MTTPCLFLDRDGVINADAGYVYRREAFVFLPGIFDFVRAVHALSWPVVVVTNQSGIGRGLYSEADFEVLTGWMLARFAAEAAPITRVYHCPFHPDAGIERYRQDHPWRKPAPGMIFAAQRDLDLDLAASALVGNEARDIAAGSAAGVGLLVLLTADIPPPPSLAPGCHVTRNLPATRDLVLAFARAKRP